MESFLWRLWDSVGVKVMSPSGGNLSPVFRFVRYKVTCGDNGIIRRVVEGRVCGDDKYDLFCNRSGPPSRLLL